MKSFKDSFLIGSMPKNRLEAFSDGVIAIVITILVLEIKVPEVHGHPELLNQELLALLPKKRAVRLVPAAIIDTGPVLSHIDPAVLVSLLWVRCGRQAGHAHLATGLPFNRPLSRQKLKEEYDEFSRRKSVQEVLTQMRQADFLFTSLGCLQADPDYEKLAPRPHRYLLETLRLTEPGLQREGVVGDLNYSFFDAQGMTAPQWNVFPALGVEAVREMIAAHKTVVVAAGKYKLPALRAALQGRLLNVLITDEQAAQELLQA